MKEWPRPQAGRMTKTLDRYLLKEILAPFFMVLFILTFVLLVGRILQIMDLMVNKGVGVVLMGKILLYLMPSFLIRTIPISLLAAILIGMGRLSADSELIVMKASGISLSRIARPIFALALAATLFTAAMSLFLSPASNHAMRTLLFDLARQKAGVGIKEKVFNNQFKDMVLYAEKIDPRGDFMENVFIADSRLLKETTVITARKAFLVSDPDRLTLSFRLIQGSTHQADPRKGTYQKMDFNSYDLNLDLSGEGQNDVLTQRKSKEMSFSELLGKARGSRPDTPESRELVIELHTKFTLPLSCLLFALVGIPLSMSRHRSGRAWGFSVAIAVVMIYYFLQMTVESLGERGFLPPAPGAWIPNVLFAVAGGRLFHLASRERALFPERAFSGWIARAAKVFRFSGKGDR